MHPTLFEIGDFSMPSYFFFIMVGFVLAVLISKRDGRRVGIDPDDVIDLALWGLILGVTGSRLLHVVADGFFWDYVHLCTDPMLVEGRDLWGRPVSELQSLGLQPKLCAADLDCYNAMTGGEPLSWWSSPKGYDVGPVCNEATGYCHPEQDCFRWAYFWSGGLVFYGAMLTAVPYAIYFTTKHRTAMLWAPKMADLPQRSKAFLWGRIRHYIDYMRAFPEAALRFTDLGSPAVALAVVFGRFACFMAGCCFGDVTYGPFGVHFPGGSPAHQLHRKEHADALATQTKALGEHFSLPVYPTQLIEVGAMAAVFLVLFFVIRRRKRFHGELFAWLLVLYGVERSLLEFIRADYRGEVLGLSTSQLISIPLVAIGVWLMVRGYRAARGVLDDGRWPPLGRPLEETVYQPREVTWDGARVAPVEGWRDALAQMLDKAAEGEEWKDVALGRHKPTPAAPEEKPTPGAADGAGGHDDDDRAPGAPSGG